MRTFRVPDLGEGLREVEIVEWHVSPSERVSAGQILVTVETEKALVDVTSPWDGKIEQLCGTPGQVLPVGAPLIAFEGHEAVAAGSLVGRLPDEEPPHPPPGAELTASAGPAASRPRAVPAVRKLASRLGIDLGSLTPTGPGGAVTSADVEAAAGQAAEGFEPLHGVRLGMARNMARAHAEVVPATLTEVADVEAWVDAEAVTERLVRAVARACAVEPRLNAWYDGRRAAVRMHSRVDLGIATQTPDGLFVPVLRDAARQPTAQLSESLEGLQSRVRERSVRPEELRDATLTLSNFGMFGGLHAALVVLPPQVAIVGAGAIRRQPVACDDVVAVHRALPLSLTFDHRAVTGAEAAGFMRAVVADLELEV